jgi:hypothetical protein
MSEAKDGIFYLKGVNDTFHDQLKVADTKATYIMSVIVLMIVWSPNVREVFLQPSRAAFASPIWLLSVVMTGALGASLVCALCVVVPRKSKSGTPLFWGAWPEAAPLAIGLALADDRRALIESYARNAESLAAICRRKYAFVTLALWGLIVAILAHVTLTIAR